jgi:UDP-galactopyranose mutase
VVNYIDKDIPYTRVIEHKHFEFSKQTQTIITKEYPKAWRKGDEPFYPVNDEKNQEIYDKYKLLAKTESQIIFGGRLGMYRYFDMHQVIEEALSLASRLMDSK